MAAGLGFKDFTTGEVLTATDVDGYLMQGIWVFADSAARDAAVTSPQEGNFAFLKDTNTTTYYTGSAWTNLDTTGMVNPMTTTGDTIYSSSGSTPARLGIGTTGQVLTVAGGVPSWATPVTGGSPNFTLLNAGGTSLSGVSTVTVSFTAQDYLFIRVENATNASASTQFNMRFNGNTSTVYPNSRLIFQGNSGGSFDPITVYSTTDTAFRIAGIGNIGSVANSFSYISGGKTSGIKTYQGFSSVSPIAFDDAMTTTGFFNDTATITSVSIISTNGNFSAGTVFVYGA